MGYLEGKELIRALRHRHREMEAKRRRDARKIKDLQASITPNRAIGSPTVQDWNSELPEEVLSNCYVHTKDPKEFFEFLSGLIGNNYSGETVYDPDKATMLCTVRKMEKSEHHSVAQDYKFEVTMFKSKQYQLQKKVDYKETAQNEDDKEHSNATNKEAVYVVTTRRIQGDDLKFRKLQKKILTDGATIFNGLPEWAQKDEQAQDAFEQLLENWDKIEDDQKEEEYDRDQAFQEEQD